MASLAWWRRWPWDMMGPAWGGAWSISECPPRPPSRGTVYHHIIAPNFPKAELWRPVQDHTATAGPPPAQ